MVTSLPSKTDLDGGDAESNIVLVKIWYFIVNPSLKYQDRDGIQQDDITVRGIITVTLGLVQ